MRDFSEFLWHLKLQKLQESQFKWDISRKIAVYLRSETANTERKQVDIGICIKPYLSGTHPLQILVHINVLFS